MDEFQLVYLAFTSFVVVSGLTMIVTYSLAYPWWKTGLGRMMIIYASAEITMSAILCAAVVFHLAPHWFRGLWFALQTVIGAAFCTQTATIVRLYRERRRQRSDAQDEGTPDHVHGSTDAAGH